MKRPSVGALAVRGGEHVLGAPRSRLWADDGWRGVLAVGVAPILTAALAAATFRPRAEAERDPTWKQLIPYLVLRDGPRIFLMRRTRAGGDPRLHDRYTIGVGGHINPGDDGIEGGLRREWHEEIDASFDPEWRLLGLLNDDADPVGAVHLGIVYEAEAGGRRVAIRETEKLSGAFVSLEDAQAVRNQMETWSALLLDHLLASPR
jgi:predicted NUDIX family phosphoesterase